MIAALIISQPLEDLHGRSTRDFARHAQKAGQVIVHCSFSTTSMQCAHEQLIHSALQACSVLMTEQIIHHKITVCALAAQKILQTHIKRIIPVISGKKAPNDLNTK